MIIRATKRFRRLFSETSDSDLVRYDMFSAEQCIQNAKAAKKLERIYHKGQEHAWDGKKLLASLLKKHGGIKLDKQYSEPLARIFAVIFWGEMAAWKISSELALELVPLEAKMAASSQAHDEARHFYVMHDYLSLLGYQPQELPVCARTILQSVLSADSLAKKLIGMQLMVEPVALTLFHVIRESGLEPVLCELLGYYERDEARHVALGIQYLPDLINQMTTRQKLELLLWEIKLFNQELNALKEMEKDIRSLGFHPREVIRVGQVQQFHAARLLQKELSTHLPVEAFVSRLVEFRMALDYPAAEEEHSVQRWKEAIQGLLWSARQSQSVAEELDRRSSEQSFDEQYSNQPAA